MLEEWWEIPPMSNPLFKANSVAEDFRGFAPVGGADISGVEDTGNGVFFLLRAEVGGEQGAGGEEIEH
jgi:hypothetical protein